MYMLLSQSFKYNIRVQTVKHSVVKIMFDLQFRHILEVNMLTILNGFQILLVVICLYMYNISHNQLTVLGVDTL